MMRFRRRSCIRFELREAEMSSERHPYRAMKVVDGRSGMAALRIESVSVSPKLIVIIWQPANPGLEFDVLRSFQSGM